jgi:predicted nucleic acid-binding protein
VADLHLSAMTLYELELGVQRLERRNERQGELLRS